MGFGKPPGVPCPPNNPHCGGDVPSVPIENYLLTTILVVLIFLYVWYIMNRKPIELTAEQKERNDFWRLLRISYQTQWIFRPDAFYKEYFKRDGSLKNKYKTK